MSQGERERIMTEHDIEEMIRLRPRGVLIAAVMTGYSFCAVQTVLSRVRNMSRRNDGWHVGNPYAPYSKRLRMSRELDRITADERASGRGRRKWTPELEDRLLKAWHDGKDLETIGNAMNRTTDSVYAKLVELGLEEEVILKEVREAMLVQA